MGILIFVFLFVAAGASLTSLIIVVNAIRRKSFAWTEAFCGIAFTIVIYLALYTFYQSVERVYVLATYFSFPFYMIFCPFIVAVSIRYFSSALTKFLSNALLISAIVSGFSILTLPEYTLYLSEYLKLETYF